MANTPTHDDVNTESLAAGGPPYPIPTTTTTPPTDTQLPVTGDGYARGGLIPGNPETRYARRYGPAAVDLPSYQLRHLTREEIRENLAAIAQHQALRVDVDTNPGRPSDEAVNI